MSKTTMSKTRGTGLLMVWSDIDAEFEVEFNRWYDEEHISRLLQVPGFLSAGRYTAIKGGPKYLAMYELEDHNVLRSAAYLDTVKYQPSPQRTKIGTSRVEIGRTAQYVVIFEFVHREVFRPALDRRIAAGAEKTRNLEQSRYVLLVVPAIELGLEFGVDVGPHHQQSGAACLARSCLAHCCLL